MTLTEPDGTPVFFSDRGLIHLTPTVTAHGDFVRVYESSLATEPTIWLQTTETDPDGESRTVTVLLTLAEIERLERQMAWLRENHYQVRPR